MEKNENNNFRIFFHSLILEFFDGGNEISRKGHSFLSIPLKTNFHSLEIGRNERQ